MTRFATIVTMFLLSCVGVAAAAIFGYRVVRDMDDQMEGF